MMSITSSQSFLRFPVLVILIVSMLVALSAGRSSCSIAALNTKRLLEGFSDGAAQFKLLHWSHPQSPHYVTGLTVIERLKHSVQNSRKRLALVSSRRQLSGVGEYTASAPAPGSADFVSPLRHIAANYDYAMEISIGTPPQRFSALADTGSDLVWIQCSGCYHCEPQSDPLFVPSNSSTYTHMSCLDPLCFQPSDVSKCIGTTNKTCTTEYGYISGGTVANMSYETITLSTTVGTKTSATHFAFGCGYENFFPLAGLAGLVGLGGGPLSFTTQLGGLFGNKFSYCLVSMYDSNVTTSPLVFGDVSLPSTARYTPMVQNPNASYPFVDTFYYIGLMGIKVNGVALDIPAGTFDIGSDGIGGVFLDSGTAFSVLTSAAYSPLLEEMKLLINYTLAANSVTDKIGLDLCYDLANVSNIVFPVVTMVFEGFELDLPQDNVFVAFGSRKLTYCLGFGDSGAEGNIFGNVQQQNFHILFDREGRRYGFAQVQCATL